jgi:lipopolysaccharide/colanic/teichoic acid biosynthesis glycosyltransferase
VLKRVIDVASSATLLVLTAPLLLLAAIAVRLSSSGHALFRQPRVGRNGDVFDVVKFRTMREDAEPPLSVPKDGLGFLTKPEDDPRITKVGRFLRQTSIDELPQLWNVLKGDMSLVGPRPLPLWEAEALNMRRRLVVRPGLTGLWQVSGRSSLAPEERIRLDLVYVQNWNLLLDLSILLRTAPAVVGRRGAF